MREREGRGWELLWAVPARSLALVSLSRKVRAVEGLGMLPGGWEAEHRKRAAARCLGCRVISQQESPAGSKPNHCHFTIHRITHLIQQMDALYMGKR